MGDIKKEITNSHLMEAFCIETQAIQKYIWYAKVAKKEGFEQIAAIFLETAEQKKSHTKTLYRLLEGSSIEINSSFKVDKIGTTLENLKLSASDEMQQSEQLFKLFEENAWNEESKQAATKLKLFRKIKAFYANRFSILATNIEEGKVFKRGKKVKWICRKCGLIYESDRALKNCPGCEHPQAYFEILNENY